MAWNEWTLRLVADAQDDFEDLDPSLQRIAYKQLQKIQQDPLNIGLPLRGNLSDFKKLYFLKKSYRIVFKVINPEKTVEVWAIGRRDKSEVYQAVLQRVSKLFP